MYTASLKKAKKIILDALGFIFATCFLCHNLSTHVSVDDVPTPRFNIPNVWNIFFK